MTRTGAFTREQLRSPFTLLLLVGVPAGFVAAAAGVLSDFATALGGSLAGDAASALSAGWAAAFIAGTLGFFAASSAKGADRRLALAGLGAGRVALARISSSFGIALLAAGAGFVALELVTGVAHPAHAAAAVLAFALVYLGIGVVIGSLVNGALEGSLAVAVIFLLDVFSGPGMSEQAAPWSVSRWAADVLIAAGVGQQSSARDWAEAAFVAALALFAAFATFVWSARSRV